MARKTATRRRFLKQGLSAAALLGASGLALPFLNPRALAVQCSDGFDAKVTDHHFIFCYFWGAWDILLSLDPRDPALFNEENMQFTKIQPAYSGCSGVENNGFPHLLFDGKSNGQTISTGNPEILGPFMGELRNHWDKMAIIRGMSMDTLTHEVGRRRFITGRQPAGLTARGASAATWLAALIEDQVDVLNAQGADIQKKLIPNLAIKSESYNEGLPIWASGMKVNSLGELQRVFKSDSQNFPATQQALVDEIHSEFFGCAHAQQSPALAAADLSHQKMQSILANPQLVAQFDFGADTEGMKKLRLAFCGETANNSNYSKKKCLGTAEMMAAAAVTALTSGVSRCVSLQPHASTLDTHFDDWEVSHGKRMREGFDTMAKMIDQLSSVPYPSLDGTCWMDHTTILAFSDFARTPLINDRGGRDHHLTNACMVLGNGIEGRRVCGRSSDKGMMPTFMDLNTGQGGLSSESDKVKIVKPEHVIQCLFHLAGFKDDPADLRVDPISAILKNS